MTTYPELHPDPIRNLLAAARALEQAESQGEAARSVASRRLERAVEELKDLGAPESEILGLIGDID